VEVRLLLLLGSNGTGGEFVIDAAAEAIPLSPEEAKAAAHGALAAGFASIGLTSGQLERMADILESVRELLEVTQVFAGAAGCGQAEADARRWAAAIEEVETCP
jgi:hypothetical protein